MSEFLSNFHFIRPFVLLLLLLPLGVFWHYARSRGRNSSWAQVCDKNLLDFLLVKGSSVQRRLIVWIGRICLRRCRRSRSVMEKEGNSQSGAGKSGNDSA